MNKPTPSEVRKARDLAGMTAAECSKLVHVDTRAWQRWEDSGPSGRQMPAAAWELFKLKTGQANLCVTVNGKIANLKA